MCRIEDYSVAIQLHICPGQNFVLECIIKCPLCITVSDKGSLSYRVMCRIEDYSAAIQLDMCAGQTFVHKVHYKVPAVNHGK